MTSSVLAALAFHWEPFALALLCLALPGLAVAALRTPVQRPRSALFASYKERNSARLAEWMYQHHPGAYRVWTRTWQWMAVVACAGGALYCFKLSVSAP